MLTLLILVISVVVLPIILVVALINPISFSPRERRPASDSQSVPERLAMAAAASAACRPDCPTSAVPIRAAAVSKQ
ncbi:MAG TPA: hypothetical protein VHO48_16280 [Anaerolineaceae bacterium]|nr:hypothetical protein [Anaerolineaceae bacterium]